MSAAAGGPRRAVEQAAAAALHRRHALAVWSLGDGVELVLASCGVAAAGRVALPRSAEPSVVAAVHSAGMQPVLLPCDRATQQLDPDALRDELARGLAAVVAWRPAGLAPDDAVAEVLAGASIPVIDALLRTVRREAPAVGYAVATCTALAESTLGGIVATDDPTLATEVERRRGETPGLDRWTATAAASSDRADAVSGAHLAAGHDLLLTEVGALDGAHVIRCEATGWGGLPELLVALGTDEAARSLAGRLESTGALQTRVLGSPEEDAGGAGHVLAVRWRRVPSEQDLRNLAGLRSAPTLGGGDAPGGRSSGRPPSFALRGSVGARVAVRAFDLLVGGALLIVCAPLFGAVALAVRLVDGSPVLFRQVRVGRYGVPFEMLKFRTMVREAPERLGEVRGANERAGPLFKMVDDPRSTRVGRLLRRTSLDELPQLLNVLGGSMSLVGPRPALPGERVLFPEVLLHREALRPGITGLWQVAARDDASFERYAELDLAYVHGRSLRGDLAILVATPGAVARTALRSTAAGPLRRRIGPRRRRARWSMR